jgi:hypothetical protein
VERDDRSQALDVEFVEGAAGPLDGLRAIWVIVRERLRSRPPVN